jgi:hypothetical protein
MLFCLSSNQNPSPFGNFEFTFLKEVLVAASGKPRLMPPEYTLWAKIRDSVGKAKGVKVGNLVEHPGDPFIVPIKVKDHAQAVAVASIARPTLTLDAVVVNVQVTDGAGNLVAPEAAGTPIQLAAWVKKALKGYTRLKKVVVQATPMTPHKVVFPVFSKAVIQFPNDDLSDLYRNFNGVVAHVFKEVLVEESGGFHLNPSTAT